MDFWFSPYSLCRFTNFQGILVGDKNDPRYIFDFLSFFLFNCLKKFSIQENNHTPKFFRIINEVPTILLIAIIFIVVFKPI